MTNPPPPLPPLPPPPPDPNAAPTFVWQPPDPVMPTVQPPKPRVSTWRPPSNNLVSRSGLVLMVVAALLANLAIRAQVANIAASLAVVAAAVVLWRTLSLRPAWSTNLAAAIAVGAGTALAVRMSTWLAALNSLTALAALAALATLGGPHPPRFSMVSLLANLERLGGGFYGPKILFDAARPQAGVTKRLAPVIRGAILALVPVIGLSALLASADAVFAETIAIDVGLGRGVEHFFVTALLLLAISALVAYGGTSKPPATDEVRPLGTIESLMILGSVAAVFALFAATQLASAIGQTDAILREQGISHADYARSGYFQLLWVAALTALLLSAVRLLARPGTGTLALAQRALAALVALLTCVIVASAIVRLSLYTDTFGQTTLRWYSAAFAWMLGVGFVLAAIAGIRASARWLPLSLISLTAVTLLIVNLVNPEARIAEHNLGRTASDLELDAEYLLDLSADAWPTLIEHREQIIASLGTDRDGADPEERFVQACHVADASNGYGPIGFNAALSRLDCASRRASRRACAARQPRWEAMTARC